ncbi:MAG: outer membrane beta-barrel protein [Chitinophagaceae bacterium]
MKRILLATFAASLTMCAWSQDSSKQQRPDTIRIGGMIIIRNGDKNDSSRNGTTITHAKRNRNANTNWWIVDLGFANVNDNTNYPNAVSSGFAAPGIGKEQMKLRTGKSVNVNIWIFMQKLNVVKRVLNLKYGMGLELNNYRFDDRRIQFLENPTKLVLNEDWKDFQKNKLAADYVTIPLMLNLNFTPGSSRSKSFGLSGGFSAGYLYSSRQKIKDGGDKDKTHDDFNLRKWKLAYIGELNLGLIKLYGSYALKSMFESGLDQTPYNVGIRLSRF